MNRIALVSDIHGNLPALEAVAADIARRGVDTVVNLGDNLSGPLLARETAQWLMACGWLSLAGNHERQLLALAPDDTGPSSDQLARAELGEAELAWLRTLRPWHRFSAEVFLCHATPRHDCHYLLETVTPQGLRLASPSEIEARLGGEAAPLIACGHTHTPRKLRTAAGQLIVNPGSVGLPAYEDDHPDDHVVELGSPDARYAIVEQHAGRWQAELLAVPYEHEPMAALAERKGRPDWALALRTGYARSRA